MTTIEYLIDRPMQITPCSNCGQHLAVAIVGGMTTYCDLAPLNIHAEIAAILTRRATYDVVPESRRKAYLVHRDIFRIREPRQYLVIAGHSCPSGMRPCMSWEIRKPPADKTPSPRRVINDSAVPF